MLTAGKYMEISSLRKRGWSISAIARHVGRDRKTVRAYLSGRRELGVRAAAEPDVFDRLDPYVRQRLKDDPHVRATVLFAPRAPNSGLRPGIASSEAITPVDGSTLHGHAVPPTGERPGAMSGSRDTARIRPAQSVGEVPVGRARSGSRPHPISRVRKRALIQPNQCPLRAAGGRPRRRQRDVRLPRPRTRGSRPSSASAMCRSLQRQSSPQQMGLDAKVAASGHATGGRSWPSLVAIPHR